jgi:hypothetical protein
VVIIGDATVNACPNHRDEEEEQNEANNAGANCEQDSSCLHASEIASLLFTASMSMDNHLIPVLIPWFSLITHIVQSDLSLRRRTSSANSLVPSEPRAIHF